MITNQETGDAFTRSRVATAILDRSVDADAALEIAENYLIDHVGDLLRGGPPCLSNGGRWVIPILLSNVWQGDLGQVGTISVEAATGEVLFSDEDRRGVKARARELTTAWQLGRRKLALVTPL